MARSVDVALIAAGPGQSVEPRPGALAFAALLGCDLQQSLLDILGHALGIAADIEVRACFQPAPQLDCVLAHAVLDVDLLGLIAREGRIEPRQHALALPIGNLILIKKVSGPLLVAEEQPVAAGGADLVLGGDIVVAGNKKVLGAVKSGTAMVINTTEFLPGDFTRNADFSLPTERLRRAIAGDSFGIEKGTRRIEVTISIGLSTLERKGEPIADVLKRADTALYRAKHDGRNRVVAAAA